MSFAAMRTLEDATLLHGIGKVSVPYGLLNTPAPLSDPSDRFVLRDYVRVGAAILDVIPVLRPAADIIRFHHEYVDGSGYPFGRSGESIPFEAQMLCISSEFAAMTAPRLYREKPAFTPRAGRQLCAGAGGSPVFSTRGVSLFNSKERPKSSECISSPSPALCVLISATSLCRAAFFSAVSGYLRPSSRPNRPLFFRTCSRQHRFVSQVPRLVGRRPLFQTAQLGLNHRAGTNRKRIAILHCRILGAAPS